MPRRVFYSFHYKPDCTRAAKIRNMGVVDGNPPATDNDWEKITKRGDAAIEQWIDDQLFGKSCAVVLIGTRTAGRKWINYEIEKAWNDNKGVFGIYVHNVKDLSGDQSAKGTNPFAELTLDNGGKLSSVVKAYDPPYSDSQRVYAYIKDHFADWIEEAIDLRAAH